MMVFLSCSNSKKSTNDNSFIFSSSDEDIAKQIAILNSGDWRLTEVNGQPVDSVNGIIPFIRFDDAGRISGSVGCNNFSSNFKIEKGNKIHFSPVISTKMACIDMSVEDRLFPILAETDNFHLNEYQFILKKAKSSPIAKFAKMNTK